MPDIRTQSSLQQSASNTHSTSGVDFTKLKRLAGGGLDAGEGDGLVDAFAEVFAAMSVPQSVTAPTVEPASQVDDDLEPEAAAETAEAEDQSDSEPQFEFERRQDATTAISGTEPTEKNGTTETEAIVDVDPVIRENEVHVEGEAVSDDPVLASTTQPTDDPDNVEISTGETVVDTAEDVAVGIIHETSKRQSKRRDSEDGPVAKVGDFDDSPTVVRADTTAADRSTKESAELGFTAQSESGSGDNGQSSRRRSRHDRRSDRNESRTSSGPIDPAGADSTGKVASTHSAIAQAANESFESQLGSPNPATSPASANATANSTPVANVRTAAPVSSSADVAKAQSTNAIRPGNERPGDVSRLLDSAQSTTGKTDKANPSAKTGSSADILLRAKLVQRVSKAFQHFGSEGGNIRLKLAPAELGSVRVEMNVRDKKVQARVVAETDRAASLLREQLPELRGRLEAQGMQIDQITVEHESDSRTDAQTMFDRGGSPQDNGRNSHSTNQSHGPREEASPEPRPLIDRVSQPALHVGAGVDLLY